MASSSASARDLPVALVLLASATAVVVAIEFIVVGLLPVLARDLEVSLAETGWLVGAFAAAAAILGPPLTLVASAQPPRRVLTVSLLVFAAGNLAAVMVPVYPMLLAVRVAQGAVLPVFVSVGAAAASGLASSERRGRVVAQANIGFVIGIIVALPAGVAMAEGSAWRSSFVALAALALVAAGLMAALFPAATHVVPPVPRRQATLLRQPPFLGHLALSVAAFAAMFAAYTYLAAWLEGVAGMGSHGVAAALIGFGLSGLIGNAVAARVADRAPLQATALAVLVMAAAATAATLVPERPSWLALMLAVWGAAQMAAVTLCQIRVMLAGEEAPAFALAMNIAAANLGITLGSLAGGVVMDEWGLDAIGFGGMGLALGATFLAVLIGGMRGPTAGLPARRERCQG